MKLKDMEIREFVEQKFKEFIETPECDEMNKLKGAAEFAKLMTGGRATTTVRKQLKAITDYDKRVYGTQ